MHAQLPSSIEPLEARIAPAFSAVFDLSSLDGSNGFKISGSNFERAGFSVSDAGDVNGDGIDDVVISARSAQPNYSGAIYVVFGKPDGFPTNFNLSALNGTNGFKVTGLPGYALGSSVSAAGDVNGDGFDDIIAGANNANGTGGGIGAGASYVVFGKASGFSANLDVSTINGSNGFKISGAAKYDFMGSAVGSAGDFNGDGFDDVIVGVTRVSDKLSNAGASYVIFGKSSGFAANLNVATLNGANGFRLSGVASNERSGYAVGTTGDVNGDGFDDVIIGAPFSSATGYESGASYVVFGKSSEFPAEMNLSSLDGSNGFKLSSAARREHVGGAVGAAGDVNGDGFNDVLIGRRYDSIYPGSSYVVFGKAGGFAANLSLSSLNGSNGFKLTGASPDLSGIAVSTAGDLNGDGFDDVIIGAPNAGGNSGTGSSYVVFGKATGFAANVDLLALNGSDGFKLRGVAPEDHSGQAVSAAGDVNGDGFGDLMIGAPAADPNGLFSGATYIVFGTGPMLSISDASVTEGDEGTRALTFTVSLSEAGINPVIVGVTTDNATAMEGSDLTAVRTQLNFAPGELSKTVTVNVTGDKLFENDETFVVKISSENAVIGDSTGVGTILNDDVPPVLGIAGASIIEGSSGTSSLVFSVSLSAGSGLPAQVTIATADDTALAGSDYTALAPETLTFAPGETSKTVQIDVLGDTSIEDHETFSVLLSNPSGATIGVGTGTGTILNEDTAIGIDEVSGLESDNGVTPLIFRISLEKESVFPVTISYATADGTAVAGSDFTAITSTQITFAPGEISKTVTVDVLGDTEVEAHETFSIALSDPVNATIATAAATGTILNDDALIRIDDVSLLEGHAGARPMTFTVSLTAPSALPVTVGYASAAGTATAGHDYTDLPPGTLTFAPGETSKNLLVDVLGDTVVESSETLSVLLTNAVDASIDGGTAVGTILDDDVTLVSGRKATFTDADGELVTIKSSKGTLKVEDFTIVPAGMGAQLALIDFHGKAEFQGANVTITAKPTRGGLPGDRLTDVGYFDATGVDLGKVTIGGDLGRIDVGDGDSGKPALKSLTVGSLGATGVSTQLEADSSLHSDFDGDLRAMNVKGSVSSGVTLAVGGRLGIGRIGGNLEGATLSAVGLLNPAKAADSIAIGALFIRGDVAESTIFAGYDRSGTPINADAGIGTVFVGGNWRASDLVAGVLAGPDGEFGTADDAPIPGGNSLLASIASIVIKGTAAGTEGEGDSFGFVAEEIGKFKVDGNKLSLNPGPGNDSFQIGLAEDLRAVEF